MKKIYSYWKKLTIKNKIAAFTGTVFLIILIAVLFDVWIVKIFMMDFNNILEDNVGCGEIVSALEKENKAFEVYIHNPSTENLTNLKESMDLTYEALYAVPLDYGYLGETRYAQLYSLRSCYEVYCNSRDEILNGAVKKSLYIRKLYAVYDMQNYLHQYAQTFMSTTLEEGNVRYMEILPAVFNVPIAVIALSSVLFIVMMQLAKMMNKTIIDPVMNLANASRKIAANDFFIDDVETENEDELGELVNAFNKMKYATGEYIMALEDKREALDQLHAQELEKLEVEKQLETMNLELLKSQINPHFLFNTLNVIGGMANLEDAETTEKMIGALSSIFRYNLKNQEAEVKLAKELKVAQDYMYLQQMRFGNRVEFRTDCGVDAGRVIVPTFTFQPLLENSVIHGLSPKIEGGKVMLTVAKDEDLLKITVEDTGVGMSLSELEALRDSLENGFSEKAGIGVSNIYRRIHAMYEDSRIDVDSVKGIGTKICIWIPYHTAPMGE